MDTPDWPRSSQRSCIARARRCVRPDISVPNTSATSQLAAMPIASAAAARSGITRPANSRGRAENPIDSRVPASAAVERRHDAARLRARRSRLTPAPSRRHPESAPARRAQSGQAHRVHRARRSADVRRQARAHEHDAHARETRFAVVVPMVHGWVGSQATSVDAGSMSAHAHGRMVGPRILTRDATAPRRATPHASYAHHGRQGGTPRRQHHHARRARSRPADGHRQGSEGFRERGRPCGRGCDRRDAACDVSRSCDLRRGRHGARPQSGRRVHVDHRSSRRHDELPAWLSAILRVDRARPQGCRHARRDLRSGPQRSLHRHARTRRIPERSPHARVAPRASARLPDRHGLPVPRRQLSRHVPADDEGDDPADGRTAPARCRCARPRVRRRRLLRRILRDRPQRMGRRRRQPARARSRRADRRSRRRRRLPARRPGDRRDAQGVRADGAGARAVSRRPRARSSREPRLCDNGAGHSARRQRLACARHRAARA